MKTTAYLKLSGSLLALTVAMTPPAMAQNSWTGGSSYHYYSGGRGTESGNNDWHNSLNWQMGTPTSSQDVNIGLATMQQWNYTYWCGGSTWNNTCSWSGTELRPVSHDWVDITGGTAQARNLNIGFSGGRSHVGSYGAGILRNSGLLDVGSNMVVGSTGSGSFSNLGTTTIGGNYIIGGSGNGGVSNGGAITVGGVTVIGQHAGVSGTLTQDPGASLNTNGLIVGAGGTGTFSDSGTTTVNGSAVIGQQAGSVGTMSQSVGASLSVTGNLVVGASGQGMLGNLGTTTVAGDTVVGQHAGATGELRVGSAGSSNAGLLTTGGNLTIGENGDGIMRLYAASTAETTGRVALGVGASGHGTALVSGQMLNHDTMTVGQNGRADVVVSFGGLVETTGRVDVASGVSSVAVVDNNNSTIINHDRLVVGGQGYGRFITQGGSATTTTDGDVTVASEETGIGVAIVDRGTMNNGGRLDLGREGEGYLLVYGGGEINNSVGVMATEKDATAYAVVTGANSLWDNRESLTLAREEGAAGVLVINDDGTVRVDGGAGTMVIAQEEGATGILNIGAMTPAGQNYGIHSDVTSDLGSIGLSPTNAAARSAGTLDAAYVQFGEGDGFVNFKHTETEANDYRFKAGFVGTGTVNHFEGFTVLDGDSSAFTGAAHVLGGILVVNNVLAGDVDISPGGTLRIGHQNGTSGHVVNDIVNNGLLQFNRSDTYAYDSIISGTGDVEQMGTGTTILTGENTYTGSTTINNGTLQLGDGGTTGSIDHTSGVAINANGTLAFNRSDFKIFDRQISGTGELAQIGTGITRLTADNSAFTGRTRIDAGTLSVNGILGGTVDVNDGGTLAGIGTVGTTTVHENGTIAPGNAVAPGNAIGTLTVNGTLTQEAGSFYQTEVLSTGDSDLIHVTGTASISDEAILNVTKLDGDRYELEHRYTVLTADGGLTGDYILTGDTFVSTFYRVEDHYDANNAYLDVTQHRKFQEAGRTINQINTATAAQELKSQRDPVTGYPTNPLFRAIAYLPDDKIARYAFDQASGELHASLQAGLLENSRIIRDATSERIRGAFAGLPQMRKVLIYRPSIDLKNPSPVPVWVDADEADGVVLWGQGHGSWGTGKGDGNAAAYENSAGGLFVGADMPIRDWLRVGIVGGYNYSRFKVEERRSVAESNNYHVGLFGGAEWRRFDFHLGANYTWNDISTQRKVVFPGFKEHLESDYAAHTMQIYGDVNYEFHLGGVRLQPYAGLAYASVNREEYEEAKGAAALTGDERTTDSFYGTLGLRAARTYAVRYMDVTARGMLGWRHGFDETMPRARHAFDGSSKFNVYGAEVAQNVAVVEAGLDTDLKENLTMGVSYSGVFGDEVEIHGVHGKLNWAF